MKTLLRLSAVMLGVGMLGASACSSCSPAANNNNDPALQPTSMRCGPNSHQVGNQCIGDPVTPKVPVPVNPSGT